ncbi:MucR family transcriptional regulator [Blastococcus mobilis]|uniref:MucR family transcriptional regulator n=1 Tax=Blastococcus mobilis TaxID=1938746 RepID=UPI000B79726F|nr:MucR family transcriptional regulator [Blastococcus mobilis]
MWHPVGDLPARVYWRRRLVALTVLLAVLGGAGWLGLAMLGQRDGDDAAAVSGTRPLPVPALERVVPSLSAVATPDPPALPTEAEVAAPAPGPVAGGPCTDEMLGLEVRTPGSAAVGSKPTFELAVANVSAVPCVRALDKGLQEIVMFDGAGTRVWGSNDCFPEASSDPRTLAPGEVVTLPIVWGGLTSEPTCTAPRGAPPPGTYVLRGRLDTKVSSDASITLG